MRKLLTAAMLLYAGAGISQTAFTTRDSLDINKLNALALVHGDMWWDPRPSVQAGHLFFPNGTTKGLSTASAIWMSGYDGSGQLHTSAQTYRQTGNDFWPGPLNSSDTLTYATCTDWAKIWKVNRTDIYHFQHLTVKDATTTPAAIWTWPAKGNAHAQGAGGAALTITEDMAPFIDLNMNGIYEPNLGDYPDIKGDQALWWVFSDNGPAHSETNGKPLGIQVHAMAYAYNRGTLIDNVVYYEFMIQNKSVNNYSNFRVGQFMDVDLGHFGDDYIGFDSGRSMGYCYNGANADLVYGEAIPMEGLILLSARSSATAARAGSFMYYNNDNSIIGNPHVDTEYSNYMRSKTREGVHASNDYSGPGTPSRGYGPGPEVKFVYTGTPADITTWSECGAGNIAGDRRMVLSSDDLVLNAGGNATFIIALAVADVDTNQACGDSITLDHLAEVADTAIRVFNGPLSPLPDVGIANVPGIPGLHVYPNPAHDKLYLAADNGTIDAVVIYNSIGQVMNVEHQNAGGKHIANIALLPAGMYYVRCSNTTGTQTIPFRKE